MNALIDITRLIIVGIFIRKVADEVIIERRPALGAAAGGFPFQLLHHGGNGLQALGLDETAHIVMAEIGAFAHGLHGGGIVAVAQRYRHQLLDKTGAITAGGGRLGVGAHIVQRGQPFGSYNRSDLALADAVAAADFRIIRQGCNGRHRVQRRPSLIGLAEDKGFAHGRDIGRFLHQVEEPRPIRRLAVKNRANDAVFLENETLVDAGGGIAQHDFLAVIAFGEVAGGKQVDACHLQLRIGDRAVIFGRTAAKPVSQHAGRFIKRRNEAIAHAAMLGAFAERVDRGVRRHHAVIHHDAAIDGDAGFLGETRGRADTDRHHHHIALDDPAVLELDALDLVLTENALGVGLGDDVDAALVQRLF
ncbi:hypothetical protein D3C87_1137540 [compost metagenome]